MARPIDQSTVREPRTTTTGEPSLGELFSELSREMTDLVRGEVELAKTEMSHKAASVGKDFGYLAAGIAVAYAGFLALVAMLIIALAHAMPWWLAALIVGVVVAAIGGYLVYQGLENLKRTNFAPTETLETLKEDAAWTKEAI
jgi:uncharacterized membrane protein YqjE